jgi:hypothetical protein
MRKLNEGIGFDEYGWSRIKRRLKNVFDKYV